MKKNIVRLFAAVAASMFAFACAPEYITPDQTKLPQASELTPVITVDQETNYVTFSIKEAGVVPMWIFGEDKINGKANKKYCYTGNGISLRIREEGTHTVELKAYNAHGVSLGSKMVEYSLDNTFRDPFDPAPYLKAMAGVWGWDKDNDGHFGCGPNVSDPLSWWSCGANGKADMGLYDDVMTFTADGMYTYNPGEGGMVYVNKDSGYKTDYKTGDEDYMAPIDEFTHPFSIENAWNEAGIEEIYLILQEGDNLSYIPNPEALTDPRYKFVNTKPSEIKKNLKLVSASNSGIAWMFSFVPFVKTATPDELLAGTDGAGKVWVMDSETAGHLGCGPDGSNPGGWWSAGPGEKAAFGLYDDELTFVPGGTYKFSPGADGKIYVNKDVTDLLGSAASEDVDIDFDAQETTYEFDGETIVFPAGTVIGYVPNNAWLADATFHVTELTETTLKGYTLTNGIAWQYIFRARDVVGPSISIAGVEVVGGKADVSLTNGQDVPVVGIEVSTLDRNYFEGTPDAFKFIAPSGDYRIYVQDGFLKVIPLVDGEAAVFPNTLWMIGVGAGSIQGKEPGWNTGEATDIPFVKTADKNYTLALYCTSGANFKFFEQPNWGNDTTGERVWLKNRYASINGNGYFDIPDADGNLKPAGDFVEGWYIFTVVDTDGEGAINLTVDKLLETYYDIEGATNLFRSATITPELWYSPASWAGGLNPEYEIREHNDYYVVIPAEVGGLEWMAQNKLHTGVATSSDKIYDFCCTILTEEDAIITIKLTGNPEGEGDPHAFFYDGGVKVKGGQPLTYKKAKISQANSNNDFTVIFDFGRVPVGTSVLVTDICFQEHLER